MLTGRKLLLTLAFALFLVLAFGAGCKGFFTDPTLQSIAFIPISPQVEATKTLQMAAWGTYSDSSKKDITNTVSWSLPTTDAYIATISTTGLVTGVGPGNTTITAQALAVAATAPLTVTLANLISIAITPTTASTTSGGIQQFLAQGNFSDGTSHDVTTQVTWASDNSVAAIVSNAAPTQGLATAQTVISQQTANITASSGSIISNKAVLTVNPSGNLLSIAVTPQTASIQSAQTQQFLAQGNFSDGTSGDVTTQVTWVSDNTAAATIGNTSPMQGLATGQTVTSQQTANITASSGSIVSNTAALTVNP